MSSSPYYAPRRNSGQATHQYPPSSSQVNLTNAHHYDRPEYEQGDYRQYQPRYLETREGRAGRDASPYYDPYATLTPGQDRPHPDMSTDHLVPEGYSRTHRTSMSDENLMQSAPKDQSFGTDESGYHLRKVGRSGRVQATDGLMPDTAPILENLNAEQREIMKQFPPDLDDENGGKSGLESIKHALKNWKHWFRLRYLHWWVMIIAVIAIVVLTTLYHKQIVNWLTPISTKVTTVAWGWIIPVAVLFIISFPPLFGHEIVLILVGLVYGIWIGFGIAALGTLLGEIGNFYAFKYCLRSTAANYERKNVHYACMAEMVREGGFWVMFLARLSAIPGHFTTAVFATVGMNIFIFTLAATLALPKQLLIVYLGVAIKNSGNGQEDTKSKVIKYVVLAISFIITVWTAYWLYQRMEKVRPAVSAKLRQRRYELLLQARTPGTEGFVSTPPPARFTYPPYQPAPMRDVEQGAQPISNDKPGTYGTQYNRQPFGVDEIYNGHPADVSSESYDPPPPMHLTSGRQAILRREEQDHASQDTHAVSGPVQRQFHRPLRTEGNSPTKSVKSPFSDPLENSTDGFPLTSDLSQQPYQEEPRYNHQYAAPNRYNASPAPAYQYNA